LKFLGECAGVEVKHSTYQVAGKTYDHYLFTILIDDDGFWHVPITLDTEWIDDLIDVLQQAAAYVHHNKSALRDDK